MWTCNAVITWLHEYVPRGGHFFHAQWQACWQIRRHCSESLSRSPTTALQVCSTFSKDVLSHSVHGQVMQSLGDYCTECLVTVSSNCCTSKNWVQHAAATVASTWPPELKPPDISAAQKTLFFSSLSWYACRYNHPRNPPSKSQLLTIIRTWSWTKAGLTWKYPMPECHCKPE